MKLFFSYKFDSQEVHFVAEVFAHLNKIPSIEIFYWPEEISPGRILEQLTTKIEYCDHFIMFCGETIGDIQIGELDEAIKNDRHLIPVIFPEYIHPKTIEPNYKFLKNIELFRQIKVRTDYNNIHDKEAKKCADGILEIIKPNIFPEDILPIGYPFDYEKDIIKNFLDGQGELPERLVMLGCPKKWPKVQKKEHPKKEKYEEKHHNPIPKEKIGAYGDWDGKKGKDPQIIPAALSEYHNLGGSRCLTRLKLTFPEARPRKFLYYSKTKKKLKVGIVVSGGIAPGINSVIAGIVKRHILYHNSASKENELRIVGYLEGLKSLLSDFDGPRKKNIYWSRLTKYSNEAYLVNEVYTKAEEGGSLIPTSRADDLLKEENKREYFDDIISYLTHEHLDILYVIGGDGSMKAAHGIATFAQKKKKNIAIIGVPKTMDNDILWVWQSFGFLSAVEWAKGAIRQIYTEVTSNPRICIMQIFGSDSGFVATHAALASGVCDLVLIPEIKFCTQKVGRYITKKLNERYSAGSEGKSPYGIVLLAETALPTDAAQPEIMEKADLTENEKKAVLKFFHIDNCRVKGQTPDELRNAGLKIISRTIKDSIKNQNDKYWNTFRVFTNEPRHLIRSISPSSSDIIFGERLGSLAVDGAMAGYRDFMISQWLTEYVMVPLKLVVLGRKRIPKDGIFWKSVLSSTGQPQNLTDNSTEI